MRFLLKTKLFYVNELAVCSCIKRYDATQKSIKTFDISGLKHNSSETYTHTHTPVGYTLVRYVLLYIISRKAFKSKLNLFWEKLKHGLLLKCKFTSTTHCGITEVLILWMKYKCLTMDSVNEREFRLNMQTIEKHYLAKLKRNSWNNGVKYK